MAYCFKRKESVAKAVRRLGTERMENALECLRDRDHAKAIHCARKDIKKVRAVLRLVRRKIGKGDHDRISDQLREAADHLAGPRDAYVKLNTLKKLKRHFKTQLAPGALRHVRSTLRKGCDAEMKSFTRKKTARQAGRILRRAAKELDGLAVRGKGWDALRRGVKMAYAKGQRAYQVVLEDDSPEPFHQWRKRAKDLWYQVTLLRPIWPGHMDAMAGELESLTEQLGDDHDFTVLQKTLEHEFAENGHAQEVEILKGLIDERQRELRISARALGARFYAEKPSAFCARLAQHWEIWRGEKRSIPQPERIAA